MEMTLISAFIAFAFVSSITPGPNNLMLMASGTNYGFARTLPHLLGVSLGFTLMIILVGAGLMEVFDAYPVSYIILKTLSVVYLVFLAWKIATAKTDEISGSELKSSKPMTFIQAAAFQWVNPKAWAMALTAISVYVVAEDSLVGVIVVALMFCAVNFPSCSCWVILGTQLRRLLNRPARLRGFNITCAILLLLSLYPVLFRIGG